MVMSGLAFPAYCGQDADPSKREAARNPTELVTVTFSSSSSEYRVKAAFVYNFTKFVEWPAQSFKSPQDPMSICTIGKNPFGGALTEAIHGKPVNGRPVEIRAVDNLEDACTCQILFIRSAERKRLRSILDKVAGHGVLTVGEMDSFPMEGGIVNLKFDGDKIRIQINLQAAEGQHLTISSHLLSLAQIVNGK
jgi:hypothetical protein